MKLINNTKTKFITSLGEFRIGSVMDFNEKEANTLSRYEGINKIEDLEVKGNKTLSEMELLKEEATALSLEFPGNISKAKLVELIAEAKSEGEE